MPPRSRRAATLAIAIVSCGPSVVLEREDEGTTGQDASTTSGTTAAPDTTTSGPTIPPSPPAGDDGVGSSGSSSDASTGAGANDEGCGFLCAGDAGGSVAECDLFAQNCPPGEKCMPWANDGGSAWNATRCSPVAKDPTQVGEPCMVEGSGVSGIDDCDVGLMCWNVDENGNGLCEDMCSGSLEAPICEDPKDDCSVANDGFIALCLASCHPLLQDCEVENLFCYPLDDHWVCASDSYGSLGQPCEYVNACELGNACIDAAAFTSCDWFSCCTRLCDLNDEAADAECQALDPAQTCEPWYAEGQAPVGYGNVGACMLAGSL